MLLLKSEVAEPRPVERGLFSFENMGLSAAPDVLEGKKKKKGLRKFLTWKQKLATGLLLTLHSPHPSSTTQLHLES